MAEKKNNLAMSDKQWVEAGINRASQNHKEIYPGMIYWFSNLTITSTTPAGENHVKGVGEAVVNFRRIADEQLLMPKKCKWEVKVLKTKDQFGIPLAVAEELKVTEKKQ